jgi:hypothetical protein
MNHPTSQANPRPDQPEANSVILTYIAHSWRHEPCKVQVWAKRILESRPELNLYLVARVTGWAVYYGLQITPHLLLSDAAKQYEDDLAHAENNLRLNKP